MDDRSRHASPPAAGGGFFARRFTLRARLTLAFATVFTVAGAVLLIGLYTYMSVVPSYVVTIAGEEVTVSGSPEPAPEASDAERRGFWVDVAPLEDVPCPADDTACDADALDYPFALISPGPPTEWLYFDDPQRVLQRFLGYGAIGLAVLVVLSTGASWALAGRILRPLTDLRHAAAAAADGSFDRRLALTGKRDEVVELAETFDQMLGRLQRFADDQRRVAAHASHELRGPLTTTKAILDTVPSGELTRSQVDDLVTRLRRTNDRNIALVEAILDLSRLSLTELSLTTMDLAESVEAVIEDFRSQASRAGVELRAELERVSIAADDLLLEQAVRNLIDNAIIQHFSIRAGADAVSFRKVALIDVALAGARIEGEDDGSPVVAGGQVGGETFFLGIENPMSQPVVADGATKIVLPSATPIAAGESWAQTTGIGVSLPAQMRRSFQYYLERERARERNTFLHYQTWYDLKPPGLMIDSSALTDAVDLFGSELAARDTTIDSFWVDDGWDYLRSPQVDETNLKVWSFDPTQFPDGFAPQLAVAQQYDASMSVWMSPFGGYDPSRARRTALNSSKPAAERLETNGAGFSLSGVRYYAAFRDRVFDMIDNQGVRGFKFDGIGGGLYQSGPNSAYLADYESLLRLIGEMRAHNDDLWINATVGTWGSPYWLWYVDSIWRDGADNGQLGSGTSTQKYVTHRDHETVQNETEQNPLFPTSAVMNHGFIFSEGDHNPHFVQDTDLTKPSTRFDIRTSAKAYFGLGLGLQELYVRHTLVAPDKPGSDFFWDTIAANARWARHNERLLSDSHMIGGDPAAGEVYGNAAWSATDGGRGILMLRNPEGVPQTFTLDPTALFQLPSGATGRFRFTERDGEHASFTADSASEYEIELMPYQVLIFEAAPTSQSTDASPPASFRPLASHGWTALASSEEITSENGRAVNAFDGDPATIWHSRYRPDAGPVPHWVGVDAGEPVTVTGLSYLPRRVGANGTAKQFRVEVSDDGTTWTPAASGTWYSQTPQFAVFDQPVTARYVRLVWVSTLNGSNFGSAAEIGLFGPEQQALPMLDDVFNNVGITAASNTAAGNFDGSGNSYAADKLAAIGLTPGASLTVRGVTYRWPDVAPGTPDNVAGGGATVRVAGTGSHLGFLVAGVGYPAPVGAGTITFTDGSTQAYSVSAPNWADLNAGSAAYWVRGRHTPAGPANPEHYYRVFAVTVALPAGKTVASVTLPGNAAVHVFAATIGSPTG